MEGKDLLQHFEGKKVNGIEIDAGDYKCYGVTIEFTDGSKFIIESEGSEGSHISIEADVKIKHKF